MYESIAYIAQYKFWIIGLVEAGIAARVIYETINCQINGTSVFPKIKKLIKAGIFIICIPPIIGWIQEFY